MTANIINKITLKIIPPTPNVKKKNVFIKSLLLVFSWVFIFGLFFKSTEFVNIIPRKPANIKIRNTIINKDSTIPSKSKLAEFIIFFLK